MRRRRQFLPRVDHLDARLVLDGGTGGVIADPPVAPPADIEQVYYVPDISLLPEDDDVLNVSDETIDNSLPLDLDTTDVGDFPVTEMTYIVV